MLGAFPMSAVLLVTLGQPVRPVGHLLKAAAFWTLIAWVLVGMALVGMGVL